MTLMLTLSPTLNLTLTLSMILTLTPGDEHGLHDDHHILQLLVHYSVISSGDHCVSLHLPILLSFGDVVRHRNQESEGAAL